MEILNEEQLVGVEIDLEELKKNKDQINESWLAMFGGVVKLLLDKMFAGPYRQPRSDLFSIRGSRSDVTSFAQTIGREKRYLEAVSKYGLDDPRTFQNKSKLDLAIKNFQAETGLTWPFK